MRCFYEWLCSLVKAVTVTSSLMGCFLLCFRFLSNVFQIHAFLQFCFLWPFVQLTLVSSPSMFIVGCVFSLFFFVVFSFCSSLFQSSSSCHKPHLYFCSLSFPYFRKDLFAVAYIYIKKSSVNFTAFLAVCPVLVHLPCISHSVLPLCYA